MQVVIERRREEFTGKVKRCSSSSIKKAVPSRPCTLTREGDEALTVNAAFVPPYLLSESLFYHAPLKSVRRGVGPMFGG